MASDNRFAVLIDADNVSVKYIKIILDEISKDGIATYKRIYGDWTNPSLISWKSTLLDNSIIPVQQYSYTTGKNSTDSAMIIDAMDILYSGRVEGFCLVSSDSDFTRLAARLRESGMTVIGMGESKTPNSFIAACNKFKYLDILSAADEAEAEEAAPKAEPTKKPAAQPKKTAQKAAAKKPKEEPKAEKEPKPAEPKKQQEKAIEEPRTSLRTIRRALRTIVRENSDEDNWIMVSQVGNLLDKRYTDFDVRNFGFSKLTPFLESLDMFEIKDMKKDSSSPQKYVRLK
ncbi:MAG: NYN domain-containing protein [Acutalibacter sp.]|uniref:NYN domain-containing protein n=1 Tax=Candidatus Acutalibacter ornithocaccae TaxID=2838416 RepID=A0A9D2LYC7_9FIRM|nr:NYN domain-containing protein [Candidatus Acutalibacter ornithocaccae]